MTVSEQNTFDELWSAKAKEMMRNTLFLDEIRDFVRMWLQQKQVIPISICKTLCGGTCKVCLVDDALSKQDLLEELDK